MDIYLVGTMTTHDDGSGPHMYFLQGMLRVYVGLICTVVPN